MSSERGDREALEARYTWRRIVELQLDPVRGNFDVGHLKEINRRIFQDLPVVGFDDVRPGEFRPAVPAGKDWVKNRQLSTVEGAFTVAYSRMDRDATSRLERTLERVKPDNLRGLKTQEFAAVIGDYYAELDYVHPFSDGNSRTLRTFTKQLAHEAGFDLDWERFNRSAAGRDLLYIARDRSVNVLARLHIEHASTLRSVTYTEDRVESSPTLQTLLRDAVRPSRAVAFERLSEREALLSYPELEVAYKTQRAAAVYFESKLPGNAEAQGTALKSVSQHIQAQLNAGESADFSTRRSERENDPTPAPDRGR